MTENPNPTQPEGATTGGASSKAWHQLVPHRPDVHREQYWPAYIAVAVGIAIQVRLPAALDVGPHWLLAAVEALLLAALIGGRYAVPTRQEPVTMRRLRTLTIAVIALVSLDNLIALGLLVRELLHGSQADGRSLVLSALAIWTTNVIIFGLWFWEFDGGGPIPRRLDPDAPRDFLFPQMQMGQDEKEQIARDKHLEALGQPPTPRRLNYVGWLPAFYDYFYLSFTNATAFSPTDTMPLSFWAKALMLVQSAAALLTIALIAARAVNILQ